MTSDNPCIIYMPANERLVVPKGATLDTVAELDTGALPLETQGLLAETSQVRGASK